MCQYHGLVTSKMLFSHSSTEREILSLDAALRMEGIPTLNLLEPKAGGDSKTNHQTQIRKHHDPFGDIHDVLPNVRFFSMRTALSVVKDNEAVTKQINNGRRPTVCHTSRTHRVDLDWLCDCIKVDPMIQIKHVNTTQELADILTKGSFIRDTWTQWTLLVKITTYTTLFQSNLSVFSAIVIYSFPSMSERAEDYFSAFDNRDQFMTPQRSRRS